VGKLERNRTLGGPGCGCDVDVRIHRKGIGWEFADWIDLAWNRDKWQAFVKLAMNRRVLQNGGEFLTG
jgi:hypothetical protein